METPVKSNSMFTSIANKLWEFLGTTRAYKILWCNTEFLAAEISLENRTAMLEGHGIVWPEH